MRNELATSKTATRMLSVLLSLDIAAGFIRPVLWIAGDTFSAIGTVASLSSSPFALAVWFVIAALMVMPYMLLELLNAQSSRRFQFTQWACKGMFIGGVLWLFMGYLSTNLNYGSATVVFLFNGLVCIGMSGILGYGLNLEQLEAEESEGICV